MSMILRRFFGAVAIGILVLVSFSGCSRKSSSVEEVEIEQPASDPVPEETEPSLEELVWDESSPKGIESSLVGISFLGEGVGWQAVGLVVGREHLSPGSVPTLKIITAGSGEVVRKPHGYSATVVGASAKTQKLECLPGKIRSVDQSSGLVFIEAFGDFPDAKVYDLKSAAGKAAACYAAQFEEPGSSERVRVRNQVRARNQRGTMPERFWELDHILSSAFARNSTKGVTRTDGERRSASTLKSLGPDVRNLRDLTHLNDDGTYKTDILAHLTNLLEAQDNDLERLEKDEQDELAMITEELYGWGKEIVAERNALIDRIETSGGRPSVEELEPLSSKYLTTFIKVEHELLRKEMANLSGRLAKFPAASENDSYTDLKSGGIVADSSGRFVGFHSNLGQSPLIDLETVRELRGPSFTQIKYIPILRRGKNNLSDSFDGTFHDPFGELRQLSILEVDADVVEKVTASNGASYIRIVKDKEDRRKRQSSFGYLLDEEMRKDPDGPVRPYKFDDPYRRAGALAVSERDNFGKKIGQFKGYDRKMQVHDLGMFEIMHAVNETTGEVEVSFPGGCRFEILKPTLGIGIPTAPDTKIVVKEE